MNTFFMYRITKLGLQGDLQALFLEIFLYLSDAQCPIMKNRRCQENLGTALNDSLIEMFQNSGPTRCNDRQINGI